MARSPDRLLDALRDVYDPCCRDKGISIVDMGLVSGRNSTDPARTRLTEGHPVPTPN